MPTSRLHVRPSQDAPVEEHPASGFRLNGTQASPAAKRAAIIGAAAVLAAVLLLFAFNAYPAPTMDSSMFVPPAIALESGQGLVNKVGQYLYPAPLFPVVLSLLMGAPTPHSAYLAIGLLGALNIGLCALLFHEAARRGRGRLTWFQVLLAVLGLVGVAARFGDGSMRPEILASLLFLIAVVATLYWREAWPEKLLWLLHALILGLMGAVQPNGALLFALLLGMYYAVRYSLSGALYRLAWVYGATLVLFGLALVLSPYGVANSIERIFHLAHWATSGQGGSATEYIQYYLLNGDTFFFGAVYLLALGAAAHLLARHWQKVGARGLLVLFVVLFLLVAYFTAIRIPKRCYNLFLFAPLFFAGCLYYLGFLARQRMRMHQLLRMVYAGTLALTTLSFARIFVLFFFYLNMGTSLDEARLTYERLRLPSSQDAQPPILVTKALWTLTEQYDRIDFCPKPHKCGEEAPASWLFVQQQHSGGARPKRQINGRPLVEDFFVHATPRLFGLRVANSMPGYAFAVYGPLQQALPVNAPEEEPSSESRPE